MHEDGSGSGSCGRLVRVNDFDGELFLRMAGARLFSEQRRRGPIGGRPLHAMASALLAVGLVPRGSAQRVVQDWFAAEEVRDRGFEPSRRIDHSGQQWQDRAGVLTTGVRFLTSGTLLERPWGTIEVRYVVMASDSTTLTVTMTQREALHGSGSAMCPAPWGGDYPEPMVLTDDQDGTAIAQAEPWGECTTEVWHAKFHADRPLAVATSWLEVDGQRLELSESERPPDVQIQVTQELDPAREHLWRQVAQHFATPPCYAKTPLEPTVEALVAAGTLTWDDSNVQQALAVVSATGFLGGLALAGPERAAAALADPPHRSVPEPWGSLLADRHRGHGPNGFVIVGATTPTFDGVTIQLVALDSTPESFSLDVRLDDATARRPGDLHFGDPQVTWWAVDDQGHHYLGHLGVDWSYGHISGFGFSRVEFWPPLDPAATWLDIMPTTATRRSVLRVPLPWAAPPESEPAV
jgi:hypothetical protein